MEESLIDILFEQLFEEAAIVDKHGKILKINNAFAEKCGKSVAYVSNKIL